jgi:DNA-binding FadR family transcriptional regulator
MYANYREVSAPDEREPEDYTTAERRAAIFDRIEQAGHYRALQRSYRELGDHYGVSHTTIRNDITAVLEWQKDNLSPHAEAELESLKTRAVEQLLEQGEPAEAYELMRKHYEALQDMGERERPPDKHEVSGPDGGPLQREIRIGGSAGGDTTSSESPDEG